MSNDCGFFMVYGEGQGAPTIRHADEETARKEAERLARNNRGVRFHVLHAFASVISTDIVWRDAVKRDDIPF